MSREQRDGTTPARSGRPASHSLRIPVRTGGRIRVLRVDDINWIEADGDHVRLHAGRVTHSVRATLTQFLASLPVHHFVQVHRSWAVNVAGVREVRSLANGGYALELRDGTVIRTGRTYRKAVYAIIGRR